MCSEGVCLNPVVPFRVGSHHCEDLVEMQEGTSCPSGGGEGSLGSHAEVAAELGPLFLC